MKTPLRFMNSYALIVAILMMLGVGLLLPENRAGTEARVLPEPPPALLLKVAALGRERVAADWMWLRALQFIGKPGVAEMGYPGLGGWMERIVDLVPGFEAAYMRTGVLLSTVPEQLDTAERLLARAEQNLVHARCRRANRCNSGVATSAVVGNKKTCSPCPTLEDCNWEIPLWRGFVSYFGKLEADTAATHFCEARRRGGPPYLSQLATRLKNDVQSCASLRNHLGVFVRENTNTLGEKKEVFSLLTQEHQIRLLLKCEKQALEQAAGAYRLRVGRAPVSIDELVDEGLLSPPFAPAGQCWEIGDTGIALEGCSSQRQPPVQRLNKEHAQ